MTFFIVSKFQRKPSTGCPSTTSGISRPMTPGRARSVYLLKHETLVFLNFFSQKSPVKMLKFFNDCKIVISQRKKLCHKVYYNAILWQDVTTRFVHAWTPPKTLFTVEFEKIFAICWKLSLPAFFLHGHSKNVLKNPCNVNYGSAMTRVAMKKYPFTIYLWTLFTSKSSVPDPWHFGVDPDPRIHASD